MVTGTSHSKRVFSLAVVALVSCLFWFWGIGCQNEQSGDPLLSLQSDEIRSGDLIFRAGTGWRAESVRLASGGSLTHVGIIDRDASGAVFVIHSDAPSNLQAGGVTKVPLSAFSDPSLASQIVVYRLPYTEAVVREMTRKARSFAMNEVLFDDAFSLTDSTKLYCTELIWRSLLGAGEALPVEATDVRFPGFGEEIILPTDLLKMTGATAIRQVKIRG